MFVLTFELFWARNGFGLFKMSMFLQPFMLGTLVVAWFGLQKNLYLRLAPLLILALVGTYAQTSRVEGSRGFGTSFVAVPAASSMRVNEEFDRLVQRVEDQPGTDLLLDTPNVVLAKFQSLFVRGTYTLYGSRNFFLTATGVNLPPLLTQEILTAASSISEDLQGYQIRSDFPWFPEDASPESLRFPNVSNPREFTINTLGQKSGVNEICDYMIGTTSRQNPMNRWRSIGSGSENFFLSPCNDVHDYLIFVESSIARHYYNGLISAEVIALNQLEPDVLRPGDTFVGIGRRMLLQILHPSQRPRLVVDLTATLKSDGLNTLPPAVIIGADRAPLPLIGRGSARVFSPPLDPLNIVDRSFIGLDMGVDGQRFPSRRIGLMAAYGTDVAFDRRLMTVFLRDASVLSEEEFQHLAPPQLIRDFPVDLANREIEYSGAYEDGWISEAAFFGLMQPPGPSTVVARGEIPTIDNPDFSTEVSLLVDGQEVTRRVLQAGRFELRAPTPPGGGRRRIELRFSEFQRLGAGDGRPVAALMRNIGFEPASATPPPVAIKEFPADVETSGLWVSGLEPDGWIGESAFLELAQTNPSSDIVLRGLVPRLSDPGFTTDIQVVVDGQTLLTRSLGIGIFRLRAPMPPGSDRRRVELRFSQAQQLPAPDGRRTAARLQYIGVEQADTAPPVPVAATPTEPVLPQVVRSTSAELSNPKVGAIGAGLDGWLAAAASFTLAQPATPTSVVVRGMVPMIGDRAFTTELQVLVDGQEVARQTLGLGEFEVRAPTPPASGTRRVELHFSGVQTLPAGDGRSVGARMQMVGFEADAPPSPTPR
jgi:hypothetical protein